MKPQRKLTLELDVSDFNTHYEKKASCWEWTSAITRGYGRYKGYPAHRISWMIHNGKDPHGMYVLHTCDNKKCVNPDHLYLGTQSDNMRDMWGRKRRTSNEGSKVHTWDEVKKIRSLYATGKYSLAELGRKFGMNRSMVYKIVNNVIWKTE